MPWRTSTVTGLRIAGSEADAPLTARQTDLRGPLAIVVGSEGQGLGPTVRRRCDLFMRIPMRGAVGSLNAAVAGSILLFEAVAQRDPEGRAEHRPRCLADPAAPDCGGGDSVAQRSSQRPAPAPEPRRFRSVPAEPDGRQSELDDPASAPEAADPGPVEPGDPSTAPDAADPDTGRVEIRRGVPPSGGDARPIEDLLPGAPASKAARPKRPRTPRP